MQMAAVVQGERKRSKTCEVVDLKRECFVERSQVQRRERYQCLDEKPDICFY